MSSIDETRAHIERVGELIADIRSNLFKRSAVHDASKLNEPEVSAFEGVSVALHGLTYGSPEYKEVLQRQLGPALHHHYSNNSHHPEYHSVPLPDEWTPGIVYPANGVEYMSLLDQLEMLADWKAAGERHRDGSLFASLQINRVRFQIQDIQFYQLCRTAKELNWITQDQFQALISSLNWSKTAIAT